MIRITDEGSSYTFGGFNGNPFTSIDRKMYLRLQMIPMSPLGSLPSDALPPVKDFIDAMETYYSTPQTNTEVIDQVDDFFGKLGVSLRYPHPDNTYNGELNG